MREKLIELLIDSSCCPKETDCEDCEYRENAACREEMIADYLLANGVVVQPCKTGDTLWRVFRGSIEKYVVSNVMYRGLQRKWQIDCMPFLADAYDDFGKTVFLDRKEAEAALKKMEGEK